MTRHNKNRKQVKKEHQMKRQSKQMNEKKRITPRRSTRVGRLTHLKEQDKEIRSIANQSLLDQVLLLFIDFCIFLSSFYVYVSWGIMGTFDSPESCKYFIQFAFALLLSLFMHYCINESLKDKKATAWDESTKWEKLKDLFDFFKKFK